MLYEVADITCDYIILLLRVLCVTNTKRFVCVQQTIYS